MGTVHWTVKNRDANSGIPQSFGPKLSQPRECGKVGHETVLPFVKFKAPPL
jgi:hypothetical protein